MIQKYKGGTGYIKQFYKLNTERLENSETFFDFYEKLSDKLFIINRTSTTLRK